VLWSSTRDAAWMLIIFGTIAAYIETVYSILNIFGISAPDFIRIGSVSIVTFVLPIIRMIFFIAAFAVMILKNMEKKK